MKKHIVLHLISSVLIIVLLIIGFSWRSSMIVLETQLNEKTIEWNDLGETVEAYEKNHQELLNLLDNKNAEIELLKTTMEKNLWEKQYYQESHAYTSKRNSSYLQLIELLASDDGGKENVLAFYGPDDQAMYVRPSFYLPVPKEQTVKEQLDFIADMLATYVFIGQEFVVEGIEDIDGKRIANIDIRNPADDDDAFIVYYLGGSASGVMTADTLIETFLQRESQLNSWVDGIHFSYEGTRDWIADHDPSICRYTYYRNGEAIEDE